MEKRLTAAVIGCGRMGAFTSESVRRFAPGCWLPLSHAEAITSHPALSLQAVCDPNETNLQRARTTYDVPTAYQDHRPLLQAVHPTLVGIATRTIGRADILRDCVAAGARALHVEKPLCNSIAELEHLAALAADPGLYLTYGTVRRHFDIYRTACELAHSGRFGPLQEVRVNLGQGALFWTHPHSVDLILFAAGARKVDTVQAHLSNVVQGQNALEVVSDPAIISASIVFDDGLVGHVGRAPGADLVLSCTQGEVIVENDGRCIRISATEGDDPYPVRRMLPDDPSFQRPQGTLAPVSQLVRCLQGDTEAIAANTVVKQAILDGQRVLFAMVQSHQLASRRVRLGEIDPGLRILARTGANFA
jgi:scyllo-inositol 2-dehydrogenase (NAD+)